MGSERSVATNEIVVDAPRERVWEVLARPDTYVEWVVGAQRIRAADAAWPQPGTRLHHSTGAGPVSIDDSTEVVAADPPSRLELLAHLSVLGSFRVELRLEEIAAGQTHVTMIEDPVEGISRAAGPAGAAFGRLRNKLSLGRLKELAERGD
jgi:uncharacterized protein YndB with AHSA1/START domain